MQGSRGCKASTSCCHKPFTQPANPSSGPVERLKQNDNVQIETFKLYGATDKDIEDFKAQGPQFVAKYWMKKWIETLKLAGSSIDWRRTFITTPMTPQYSRFVEWQYNTLRKKGYVVQGTHPVIWCPHDQSPTGDHDRLKGEGESPIDYIIIKFRLATGEIVPCATLRPETVYGVTNIWINPEAEYVKAEVDSETWIMSERAATKLADQLKKIKVIGRIRGEELIGKYAVNPVLGNRIIIFPAKFVEPNAATGIVMSVPSHAPYDCVELNDIQNNPEKVMRYKVGLNEVMDIKPISVVKTPEFGEHPAIEISKRMNIKSPEEKSKLDQATNALYKKEYHQGILRENCGVYSGLKVSEVKDRLSKKLIEEKVADVIWEPTGTVVCRCGTENHVKILENQWFLKYSDNEWKEKVRTCIRNMAFYPEEVRKQFENTVEWLKEKACTRRTGLGTPLPWDKEWIVETLSDSTIYMAYYTIARIINEKNVKAEKLTDEVLDYIFLGKGSPKKMSKDVKLDLKILEEMRKEFEYFYPVNLRTSGKDLVQNHLTFFMFHHTAIWDDPKYWPKSIGVNGYVNVAGTKMSKRWGNVIPLIDLIKAFGADLVRINIVAANEALNDADWREENIQSYRSRFHFLYELAGNKAKRNSMKSIDLFMQSRLQQHVESATQDYEDMRFRSVVQAAFFELVNDIKWYIERVNGIGNCNKKVLDRAVMTAIKLIAPITPHVAEELWNKIGSKSFVSIADWPVSDKKLLDKNALEMENVFKKTVEDLHHIIKLAGKKESAYLYFVTKKELEHFRESLDFLKRQFGFKKISIFLSTDKKKYDPQNKAGKSKFGKPGIYLE